MHRTEIASRRATRPGATIGRDVRRIDAADKVRGEATYESDLAVEGLAHGAVVRSELPHGRLRSVELGSALDFEGVLAAVERAEILGVDDNWVRHCGDVVAAVAATDESTAREAAAAVEYEIEPAESTFDPSAAVEADAPQIHPNNPDLGQHRRHEFTVETDRYRRNLDDYHRYAVGDVDSGFQAAEATYCESYTTPRVHHCNLHTHCCVAEWDDSGDGPTLRLTQTIGNRVESEEELAQILGLDDEQVVVEVPPAAGSSFGGRSLPKHTLEPVATTLAREADRPVRLWFDRSEEFVGAETRHVTQFELGMGIDASGRITALEIDLVVDTGAYPNGVGHIVLSNSRDRPLDLYRIPNYRFEGVSVFTNNVPAGEYRGIGVTQLTAVLESHLDELARQADLDPVEVRRRNFVREGETPPTREAAIRSNGVEECLRRGMERFEALRRGETDDPERRRGWGVAAGTHTTGVGGSGGDRSQARIRLAPDGTAVVETAAIDLGQGSSTVMAQIVAEETGIVPEQIEVRVSGELDDPLGSVASRSTYVVGAAVRDAARRLADDLREGAAETFDIAPDAVALCEGKATSTAGSVDLDALTDEPLIATGRAETADAPPAYGVHFAEVEVDEGTGEVRVLALVPAQDVGFAINPAMVEGQLEGAVCHGIEFALHSELRLVDGRPDNGTLADYSVISPVEMPDDLDPVVVESVEETGPYGAKGVGTPSLPPVAPAVLNALRDCTGVRFTDLPADPQSVLRALRERQEDAE